MNNKLLIGALVGVATAIVVSVVTRKKKYAEVVAPESEESSSKNDPDVKKKIASAAAKMTHWILDHKNDIEAVTLVVSLAASVINLKNKVNDGRKAVTKTPTDKSTLDWVIQDMLDKDYKSATVDWKNKALFDISMRKVVAA